MNENKNIIDVDESDFNENIISASEKNLLLLIFGHHGVVLVSN